MPDCWVVRRVRAGMGEAVRASYDHRDVDVPQLLHALRLDAKHEGDKWVARCPSGSHEDAHPSWEIIDAPGGEKHGLHTCYSCKYGGTAYELVALVLGVGNNSAVDWIRERAMGKPHPALGVEVKLLPLTRPVFRLPAEVIEAPLASWVTPARLYAQSRGIDAEQVSRWRLGYALEGRLHGRIVFPTVDAAGRVASYTARTFVDSPKRYLNASNEEGPDLEVVYGERYWPQTGLRDTVVVTEGAINALAVERVVLGMNVAVLNGSNVRLGQVMRLATFRRALLLTDPDPAGDRAAEMLMGALVRHVDVRRVRLPKGKDAATVHPQELSRVLQSIRVSQ